MIELTIRLVASLAVVVGLLLLAVRLGGRRFRAKAGTPLQVVHRQQVSRSTSLMVVQVGRRSLVLGATEHQINVLAELDESEVVSSLLHEEIIDMEAVRRAGLAPEAPLVPHPVTPTFTDPGSGPRSRRGGARAAGSRKAVERTPGARKAIGGGTAGGRKAIGGGSTGSRKALDSGTQGGRRALESGGARRAARPEPRRRAGGRTERPEPALAVASGPLAGSILSPQTWRVALAAAKGRS